jgi:CxxC-x17-CxxC domain-containing protein
MPEEGEGDKNVTCVDCGAQFVFTARDQAFYQERGFQPPRRCRACRDKRKTGGGGGGGGGNWGGGGGNERAPARGGYGSHSHSDDFGNATGGGGGGGGNQFKVTCSGCGTETTVPFKPDPNRPVYCRNCYQSKKKTGPAH